MEGNSGDSAAHLHAHLSEDFGDDGNGLELSLGLGLGLGLAPPPAHKRKAPEASSNPHLPLPLPPPPPHHLHSSSSSSSSSADLVAGEPSLAPGSNVKAALKPNGKANSGLDAALKKFLEGKLGDEEEEEEEEEGREGKGEREGIGEEEGKKHSASSSERAFEQQKKLRKEEEERRGKKEGVIVEDGGERGEREAEGEEMKRNPFLFKEIHVSSSSRGPIAPLFVDAFKMGTGDGDGNGDGESLEQQQQQQQQRRLEEARMKRKFGIEEPPNQNKGKIARDDASSHGFRRPGSSTWLHGLDADRPLLSLSGEQEVIKREDSKVGQEGPRPNDKTYEHEGNESMGGVDQKKESAGNGEASTGVEVNFMPQLRAQDIGTGRETSRNVGGDHPDPTTTTAAAAAAAITTTNTTTTTTNTTTTTTSKGQGHGRDRFIMGAGSSGLPGKKEQDGRVGALMMIGGGGSRKVPSETSSTGTDGTTDKVEEKNHGEASSMPIESSINDKAVLTPAPSPFPMVLATDGRSYPPMQQPPFPTGPVPFFPSNFPPYVISHASSSSSSSGPDGQVQNVAIQSSAGSAFQSAFAGPERTLPVSSAEGTASWMHGLRSPHAGPPTVKPQNMKVNENGSATADAASAHGNHPFYRALTQNGSQDPAMVIPHLHRPSGQPVISAPGSLPQFSSQIMPPDTAEHRSLKDQACGMTTFPGFASSQGFPGMIRTPSNNSMKDDKVETQQNMHNRNSNHEPTNAVAQEEIRRALGGQFHQGTTDNLSVIDGLGEDIANLQRGVFPGLKFGGTGTTPDLPWVHTTAPNGRTIGGVIYRFSSNQLKIVCACHGKHMSLVEFTQHASVDMPN